MRASSHPTGAAADEQTRTTQTAFGSSEDGSEYLTDGVNLYRLIGQFDGDEGPVVGIEDCRSYEVVLLALDKIPQSRLRRVVPRS